MPASGPSNPSSSERSDNLPEQRISFDLETLAGCGLRVATRSRDCYCRRICVRRNLGDDGNSICATTQRVSIRAVFALVLSRWRLFHLLMAWWPDAADAGMAIATGREKRRRSADATGPMPVRCRFAYLVHGRLCSHLDSGTSCLIGRVGVPPANSRGTRVDPNRPAEPSPVRPDFRYEAGHGAAPQPLVSAIRILARPAAIAAQPTTSSRSRITKTTRSAMRLRPRVATAARRPDARSGY